MSKYSAEKYRAKIEAGGLTRRQEINRTEYARALLDNPKATWKDAQKQLSTSQLTILTQTARMKDSAKEKQAGFHLNDWKAATQKWQALAKNTPDQKKEIQMASRKMQLKMLYGKEILTLKQRHQINALLAQLLTDADDFGSYWGY